MASADTDSDTRNEREETDASLLAERDKTDAELAKAVTSLEEDADQVLEVARQRAEAVLDTARELADRDMTTAGVGGRVRRAVEIERGTEDEAIAEERMVADQLLPSNAMSNSAAGGSASPGTGGDRRRTSCRARPCRQGLGHARRLPCNGEPRSAEPAGRPRLERASAGEANRFYRRRAAASVKHAERIQRFVARMNRLVGDLLDVVSLESGTLHILPTSWMAASC